jgi:hypothetical protein
MSWISLTRRLGAVLLMIGLALGLVSLIPAAPMGGFSGGGSQGVPQEKYVTLYRTSIITPQTGLRIDLNASDDVYAYVLDVLENDLQDWSISWVRENFPNLNDSALWYISHNNLTVLDAFLDTHSDVVVWKSDLFTRMFHEVFPAEVSNATIIVANPSLDLVRLEYEIESITSLAPRERTFIPAQLLILVGVILIIPWIFFTRVRKAPSRRE